jgi:predicted acetyltransferase
MLISDTDVALTPLGGDEPPVLTALFQLYIYDFSEILGFDVPDDGRFQVPPIDAYWADPRNHAFLLRVGGKLAGFALVSGRSRLTGDEGTHDMAEFFVMRKYRRHGVGKRAAARLFGRFPGPWEVREKAENLAAIAFWRGAIGHFTGGRFEETIYDDTRWRGPVQRFDSRPAP